MVSTLAGVHSPLLRDTTEAAVYCGIMNPEFSPGFGVKKGGKPRCPLMSLYTRRSEMLPNSANAMAA